MAIRALERLKKAASMAATRRVIELPDGSEFEFWMSPLTLAQRNRAQKNAKSDNPTDFALQLLVDKATDEDGRALFTVGDLPELRHDLPASVVEALLLQLIGETPEGDDDMDYKSSKEDAGEGSPADGRASRSRTAG